MGDTEMIILVGVILVIVVIVAGFICVPVIVNALFDYPPQTDAVSDVIKRLRGLNFEVEVVLDEDGEIFSETTQYDTESVYQSDKQTAQFRDNGDLISIHNHVDNTPPSMQDLLYTAEADFAQMIVVTPTWIYRIMRPEWGWEDESEVNEAVNKHIELFKGRRVEEPKLIAIESDGAIVTSENYEIISTDAALKAVCEELGYEMVKEELANKAH